MPELRSHHRDRLQVLAVGPRAYSVNDAAFVRALYDNSGLSAGAAAVVEEDTAARAQCRSAPWRARLSQLVWQGQRQRYDRQR